MGSSYQLKFSSSQNKSLNKKKNNGDSKALNKLPNKTSVFFTLFFLERNCLLNSGLHALGLFWAFAFIRYKFALVVCYFLSLSESSASDSYMLCYANGRIVQVAPDVLLGVTDSPKAFQGQVYVKKLPRISKIMSLYFGDLLKNCWGYLIKYKCLLYNQI